MGSVPPVLLLLLLATGLLLGKVEATCDDKCTSISVNVSTNQITVSGQVDGLVLQNITYPNGTFVVASGGSYNNTSQMTFLSGTQYIMHYGNNTYYCCYNFTTKPYPVNQPQYFNVTSTSVSLYWSAPNESQSSYTYRVQTNVTSPSSIANNIIVTNQSATIENLISGQTYTFLIYTRAADNVTESDPVSLTTCTEPLSVKLPQIVAKTTNSTSLTWTQPDEYQSSYTYRVQTNVTSSSTLINNTIVNSTSATIGYLTAGETYTFLIYTVSACNSTESDSVPITDCTLPRQAVGAAASSNTSVNSLFVSWTAPQGKVSNYTVTITEYVNNTMQTGTIQPNMTQVNFTGLLPGRVYNVTIVTVSSSCSQAAPSLSQATYPTPPGSINFTMIGTKDVTLSWGDPVNMTGVVKSYNITYWNSSSPSNISGTVISNTTYVTLQNLISGTNYSVSVVTVIPWGYQSTSVIGSVCTKPMSVKLPQIVAKTTNSISLTWTQPNEYQSSYTYRVQTNVTSSSTLINNTIVNSASATIGYLTAGETYTFTVYTISACNIQSDPVPITDCTLPGQAVGAAASSNTSVNSLFVSWTAPQGKVSNYTVTITEYVNNTMQTGTIQPNMMQVNFTGLLPGRVYNVTIVTVSSSCSQAAPSLSQATYPTPPGSINFTMIGTKDVTLSWGDPVNMTGVVKSYNITYWNSSSPSIISGTLISNTTYVTLQNLISGTNYSVSVVTVIPWGYQSTSVIGSVCTKPLSVTLPQIVAKTTNSISLTWTQPNEYQSSYTYRVLTNVTSSSTLINNTIVSSASATIGNLTAGETYTFTVYTISACNIQSAPVSITDCTLPGQAVGAAASSNTSVNSLFVSWTAPQGKVSNYTVTITEYVNNTMQTGTIQPNMTQVNFTGLLPGRVYNVTIVTVSSSCSQAAPSLSQATYPTPPGSINFTMIGTKDVTLSWGDPVNMTGVVKSYNITYWKSSSPSIISGTVISNTTYVTLQNLISGTNYSFSVVTVIPWGYQSTSVIGSVCTKPMSVKLPQIVAKTTNSTSLTWTQPDEYQSSYTYRVQTNVTSSSTLINNTIVNSTSATIGYLTAGETYTFTVYTISACNIQSDPVPITDCTLPGQAVGAAASSNTSVNSLFVSWTAPQGKVSNYTVTITEYVNNTMQTGTIQPNMTQVNFTGLLPGRVYNVTIVTVSSSCSQAAPSLSQATYPTPPGSINFTMIGTKDVTLSWGDPVNMTGVVKSYNITYWNSSSPSIISGTVISNTTYVTLQNLISGTNYSVSVVTVIPWGYQSTSVIGSVCTKPLSVTLPQIVAKTTNSTSLNWTQPDEYQSSYTYRVQTNVNSSSTLINNTTVSSTLATIGNLTAGETYTFTVYTISACNIESDPVSITDCPLPGQAVGAAASSNTSVNSLFVSWTAPQGNVSNYTVTITEYVNNTMQTGTIQPNMTQVNFTGLLPGRVYNVTIVTVSSSCSQAAPLLSQATYPTPPGSINFTMIGTKNVTLSWGDPVNMTGVVKSYNITYWNSSSPSIISGTVISNTTYVTLQNLISGTNYSVSVVTVIPWGYQSTSVIGSVCTKPISVTLPQIVAKTTNSMSLTWTQPDEYQSSYTYRVQTNVTSSSTLINNTIVSSASATIGYLTAGETYTFTVYTISACNIQSDPVSITDCTLPRQAVGAAASSNTSVNSLFVSWTAPQGKVSNYTVTITEYVNNTMQTGTIQPNMTQVNFTGLLPGRVYNVTIVTVSSSCSQAAPSLSQATYPTPPGSINFTMIGTKDVTLSWGDPVNMTGVVKSYNITYWNSSSPSIISGSVISNTTYVTLQNLISGTNYSVSVVTVIPWGYQSTSVIGSVCTKPISVTLPQIVAKTTNSMSLTWTQPDEYQSSYTYRVQTNVTSSSTLINNTIVSSASATIGYLTAGETYTFTVYTISAYNIQSDPMSITDCTLPGQAVGAAVSSNTSVNSLFVSWTAPQGKVSNYTVTITEYVNNTMQTGTIQPNMMQVNFTGLLPGRVYNVTIVTVSSSCSQAAPSLSQATYPTPPGSINFTMIGTKDVTLSWGDPVNMTGVVKSYNITYWNSSSPSIISGSVISNTTYVTLQNLISGTNYSVSVVTVIPWGYQSTSVIGSVCTKPISVTLPQIVAKTTNSTSLTWTQPDEYQSSYTYRVQTNVTSSSTLINNTIVSSASATIGYLTAGETYTFTVYTISACNVESDPVSITDCTLPGQAVGATASSNTSVNSLFVSWTAPQGKVSNYTVTITEYVNNTMQTGTMQPNMTQVNFTGLLPGRVYNVTIVTVSSSCSQAAPWLTQATYPTPPGSINFTIIGTKDVTVSWGDPVNMTGVVKSYNITYWKSSSPSIISGTVISNTTYVTLQNLISGTNYSVSVVTVIPWGYQSTSVIGSVCTKPISVTSLQIVAKTTNSISLTWTQPVEYQSSYTYRVQTNVTSSSTLINNTTVSSASATIGYLTAGETYTFTVYTISACNVESDPVSKMDCTLPKQAVGATVNSYTSVNSLVVNWTAPGGKMSYYNVTITGDVNNLIKTNITQVTFNGLSPGREYNVTILSVSGSCSQAAPWLTQATYPTPPGSITFITIGTNTTTLSWGEPENMTGVTKSYNITYYWNASSPINVTSNSPNITLLSLKSGSNYTITVVTVGVRGYLSTPVSRYVFTKPMPVQSLQIKSAETTNISLIWTKPDEYQSSYTYRVQKNVTSPSTLVSGESATIGNLTPGETYTFNVYVRAADNSTESDPVSVTNCTFPEAVSGLNVTGVTLDSISLQWTCPIGIFTSFSVTYGTQLKSVSSNCDINRKQEHTIGGLSAYTLYTITISTLSCERTSAAVQIQIRTPLAPAPAPTASTVVEIKPSTYNQISYTFLLLDGTNGPVGTYAVIVTTDNAVGKLPSKDVLTKTYSDFTSKSSSSYVSMITNVTANARQARDLTNNGQYTVQIGDGSAQNPYYNGPLQAVTTYCVTVAGFTQINYKPDGTINTDTSLMTFVPYSYQISTPQNPGVIAGAVVGTILGVLVIGAVVGYFVWYRRRNKGKPKENGISFSNVQSVVRASLSMSTTNFPRHFQKQSADCNLGFSSEYEKLCTVGKRLPKTVGDHPENREKNRYTNVLPYDISRVTLSTNGNSSDDYINANFIPGFIMKKEFIAAQGPLPRTLNDFWRMVWEKDVRAIAMLTRCVELGKVKCEEYWPTRSSRKFGNLSVAASNETVLPDWTIRDFIVTNTPTKQSKQVRHFHFTAWPDHGVPKATKDLVEFRNLIREYTSCYSSPSSPILVHCSAGVGRTGTLIALDRIIKQIEAEDKVDVYGVVHDLRMHRDLMVQTESQYVFLNQCALDFINSRKAPDYDIYQNSESIYQNSESIYQNADSVYQNVTSLYPSVSRTNL
ncbi:receptor-type tyrosine-protein phosphatase beta-like [Aquarana catesbeiana]